MGLEGLFRGALGAQQMVKGLKKFFTGETTGIQRYWRNKLYPAPFLTWTVDQN